MLGLIKKDLLMIKGNLKLIVIILFVVTIMSLNGLGNLSFVPALISIMLFMSTFSYDEYNKWDSYAITLPNGRKNVVKSKYLATLILVISSVIITTVLSFVVGYLNNDLNVDNIMDLMIGSLFVIFLIQTFMYPFIFKFGMEKGKIGLFVSVFLAATVVQIVFDKVEFNLSKELIIFFDKYLLIIGSGLIVLLLVISYFISKKIYLKKEF